MKINNTNTLKLTLILLSNFFLTKLRKKIVKYENRFKKYKKRQKLQTTIKYYDTENEDVHKKSSDTYILRSNSISENSTSEKSTYYFSCPETRSYDFSINQFERIWGTKERGYRSFKNFQRFLASVQYILDNKSAVCGMCSCCKNESHTSQSSSIITSNNTDTSKIIENFPIFSENFHLQNLHIINNQLDTEIYGIEPNEFKARP